MLIILLLRTQEREDQCRESIYYLREYLNHCKWPVRKNRGIKGTAFEGTEGNKVYVTGNWSKENPCYKMAELLQNMFYKYMESRICK